MKYNKNNTEVRKVTTIYGVGYVEYYDEDDPEILWVRIGDAGNKCRPLRACKMEEVEEVE